MSAPFEVQDDELLLAREGSGPLVYVRVAAGPWYPRDPEALERLAKDKRLDDTLAR
jgi:hypothetical protein